MTKKIIRILAIIAYLLIFLQGSIIGLPLLLWLPFVSVEYGNPDQIFAILALIGLFLNFKTWNSENSSKTYFLDSLIFILVCSPLLKRLSVVPIEMFNYLAFIIPTTTFMVLFIISIFINQKLNFKK